ncbi:Rieske (2Fe-2S) protein [Acinetobacter gerneri]|uniref:Rieske (2Fe-2S) protein n=1 Tax=Acinetobacter gerneri TaxID=202952 RepID=UPI003A83BAA7
MGTRGIIISELIFLIKKSELGEGIAKGYSFDQINDQLFLTITDNQVSVWRNKCPHNHRPLEYQKDKFLSADGKHIVCYAHSAHFDKDTGLCFAGPCLGKKLNKIQHIEINEKIYISAEDIIEIK